MKNIAFDALIGVLNNILGALKEYGYNLYDFENEDYYVSEVYFDREDNKVKVRFKEEIKKELSEESQIKKP